MVLFPFVLLLCSLGWSGAEVGERGCAPCQPSLCAPLPADGCPLGAVRDSCRCCLLCAAGEGEPCGRKGRCAAGLECLKVDKKRKGKAGVCVCKNQYEVCGSDGVTYRDSCQLKAASLGAKSQGKEEIEQVSKGPCGREPSIVTPPKEIWNVTGAQVYLSCEAIGIPTPILIWNKITQNKKGAEKMELLPGDHDNLAIQTRGGPEKHEVTGWVLISPLKDRDAGEYECHASNSKGKAVASASIHVVQSIDEIPLQKDKGEEL
ncbi:insulin-like growth factor-binding protein 7 [Latimeria chalumnae]|uniref:insulin-like growth factor-binding protein 7 n=1 Tax=Latimeria chalumnae TaxID=7897 RepID=UPI00313E4CAE